MNADLEWTGQLGYAMAMQQAAVLDSIQRLRRQTQNGDDLETTEQQRVIVQDDDVVIQPAYPGPFMCRSTIRREVYGERPYPSYPPVYIPAAA